MSAAWLWVPGAYGSTQNDGWLQVLSFSFPSTTSIQFLVTPDSAESSIFSMSIRGDSLDEIILFIEPQTVFRFYKSMITSVFSSERDIRVLSFQISFGTFQRSYSGNP